MTATPALVAEPTEKSSFSPVEKNKSKGWMEVFTDVIFIRVRLTPCLQYPVFISLQTLQ